ncbi:uncharacterized protein LOC119378416, partial [Rhipicephalus sanguineus]|uniref:uncharacterized protein LOC119378416 n=1 Tax=Rhipicephalus sanguineus TaxID=34632 RepID=UPI0020C4F21F
MPPKKSKAKAGKKEQAGKGAAEGDVEKKLEDLDISDGSDGEDHDSKPVRRSQNKFQALGSDDDAENSEGSEKEGKSKGDDATKEVAPTKKVSHKEKKLMKKQSEYQKQLESLNKGKTSSEGDQFTVSQADKSAAQQIQQENAVDIK